MDDEGARGRRSGESMPQDEGHRGPSGREVIPDVGPAVAAVVERTTRFSREFLATTLSLVSAAFGLIAALAWNTAITKWLSTWLTTDTKKITGYFVYAGIVTLIGVVVIVLLARLAARIKADPIEFKYPGSTKG
jgi:Family of unknown function (DUF5654)